MSTERVKPRRSFEVLEFGPPLPQSGHVAIVYDDRFDASWFVLIDAAELASPVRTIIAQCESAKRLSDFAFESGAQEVRHAYNLKLSDSEA